MSSGQTDPQVAAIIAVYDSLYLSNRSGLAAFAFLVYEYAITFDQEVHMFWAGRWTGASILFFMNRYIPILAYVVALMEFISMSDKAAEGLVFIQYLTWASFSGLRALALSRRWYIAVPIFTLSVVAFGVNMSQYGLGLFGTNDPIFGCMPEIPISAEEAKKCTFLTLMCTPSRFQYFPDICLIALTWVGIPKFGGIRQTMRLSSLSSILLRDGLIYFTVLFVLNSLHLAFTMISFVRAYSPTSYITIFTEPITAVAVSRFLLDLQAANRKTLIMDTEDPLYFTTTSFADTLSFARVVGSLGSSIIAGEAGQQSLDFTTSSSDSTDPTRVDEESAVSPIAFKEGEPAEIELEHRRAVPPRC
ncbi:hypothetical protein L227DRAFT_609267 [Lentinus tigrinus ALCF2SS1-6]|uniref:DUF6533 domain-containing protein n=1 Tax=Lentinus tigrinus ALCF2SS1-6 TaxID=1328759 RepID=A0A5C2SFY9_9APHY|nr:hypothetical protein L227DRAFT_609267 [Lentinus tigrinus ALCF2SS1-6]